MKNKPKSFSKFAYVCAFFLSAVFSVGPAFGQTSVGEIFQENGFEWFFGNWRAQTDDGIEIKADFSLAVDGCVLISDVRVGDGYKYRAIAFCKPGENTIVDTGADNRASSYTGTWEPSGNKIILKLDQFTPARTTQKTERVFSSAGTDTMAVEVYVFEGETKIPEPVSVIEFKRALMQEQEQKIQDVIVGGLEQDVFKTSAGELKIVFVKHGSLLMVCGDKVIHIDPVGSMGDYSKMPKADLILITHEHGDHLDAGTVEMLSKDSTVIMANKASAAALKNAKVISNGDTTEAAGVKIEAVPAYNIVHTRSAGNPYHPKGNGNGYIITFGDKRIYVAGDTENTPEMKSLKNIDIAFLPMNLPYTMTPEMVADAAKAFMPKVLYPYHLGQTDTSKLVELLKDTKDIEVRIRKMP